MEVHNRFFLEISSVFNNNNVNLLYKITGLKFNVQLSMAFKMTGYFHFMRPDSF